MEQDVIAAVIGFVILIIAVSIGVSILKFLWRHGIIQKAIASSLATLAVAHFTDIQPETAATGGFVFFVVLVVGVDLEDMA